jgi:KDO2-lipid IV(A) lauroyltransferase
MIPLSELETRKGKALKIILTAVGALPLWLIHWLAKGVAWMLIIIPNRHRRVTWHNLNICFPEMGKIKRLSWLVRSLQESTKGMGEMGYFWHQEPNKILGHIREIEGEDILDQAVAEGRPILFGAPHLGSWELLNLYLSTKARCAFLYRERHDEGMDKLILHARQRLGATLIQADRDGVRKMLKRLKAGDLIGILPDHQPRRGQGVFAPFFNHLAFTMVLFSKLIQRVDPVVIFGYAERLSFGRGYRLHLKAADPGLYDPDVEVSCRAMNAQVERMAMENPLQYEWTYKRFGARPDGTDFQYAEDPFTDPPVD